MISNRLLFASEFEGVLGPSPSGKGEMGLLALTQKPRYNRCKVGKSEVEDRMNWKRLTLGILTALAMLVLTYVLPRGGALREASLVQFPMTVGVWAIFVLLFVKLK